MSEIKHTAEPWEISESGMRGQYREINANFGRYSGMIATTYGPDCDANARRIVACVNACKDIPTEWLEANGAYAVPVPSLRALLTQRDELLAALKQAEGFVEGYVGEGFGDDFDSPTLEIIRKAIAKAESKL